MKVRHVIAASVALAALAAGGLATSTIAKGRAELENDKMIGVQGAFVGPAVPVRGLAGGGLPWAIGASEVEVKDNGKVEVSFQNLVFAAGPNVGKNTVGTMKVVVSCLTVDGGTVNVSTPAFPVTVATATDPGGDGSIEAKVALPSPCLAPLVFVTTTTDRWFAVNGL